MPTYSKIDIKDQDLLAAIQGFLKSLLESKKVDALMVPMHLPMNAMVMPSLIIDPDALDQADPLSPSFPVNAAKSASKLTRTRTGKTIGLVMRPCEIRAFIELVKLKQAAIDEVVIISVDCLGALSNADYQTWATDTPMADTHRFHMDILNGNGSSGDIELAPACRSCEYPVSKNADINIELYGTDVARQLIVEAATPKGEDLMTALSLEEASTPMERQQALETLMAERTAHRDQMFDTTSEKTSTLEKLTAYLSRCVNCYNCRVACPVCYCKECVFVTDVFNHPSFQYISWAERKGVVKLPADTDFFHLTRMAHISLTCVGCGQCSNACPNDIPLMELFRTVAHRTQTEFDYEPGRDLDEPLPLSVFREKEYEDVVGISSKSA
jgi:formate dehydrogenase subunit beta